MTEKASTVVMVLGAFLCYISGSNGQYQPTWDSLDTRPLPEWFDKEKIGIFLHWGVYAVPSYGGSSEWFWAYWKDSSSNSYVDFMNKTRNPYFTYQDFAKEFSAEFFDPKEWADLFQKAGARYVVLTSKHHEGYTLWPSTYSFGWNAQDVGPNRDLVGELSNATKEKGLHFGVYYSLYEWYNPIYIKDKDTGFASSDFTDHKMIPEMKELVQKYEPEVFWVDGDWEAYDTYFKSKEFLAWLYNESPVKDKIVVNDRWGIDIPCKHGDFWSCADRYNPGVLVPHKWENAMTVDRESWGYRRNINLDKDVLTPEELIKTLVETISCGGNLLVNVGPTKEGTIVPIFQERLLQLGAWLKINGEAIYQSRPWTCQNDTLTPDVWYTADATNSSVFAIFLKWPQNNVLPLQSAKELFRDKCSNGISTCLTRTVVKILGTPGEKELRYGLLVDQVVIHLPSPEDIKGQWGWVLKITPQS